MNERTFQKDGLKICVSRYPKDEGGVNVFVTVWVNGRDIHADKYEFDVNDDWAVERAIRNARYKYRESMAEDIRTLENNATNMALMVLKAIILLNGAAAIALFAFLSPIWAEYSKLPDLYLSMGRALDLLVRGVFVGLGATLLGYMVLYVRSYCYQTFINNLNEVKWTRCAKVDNTLHVLAITLGVYGYYCFGAAAWNVRNSLFAGAAQTTPACAETWTVFIVAGSAVLAAAVAVWAAMRKKS